MPEYTTITDGDETYRAEITRQASYGDETYAKVQAVSDSGVSGWIEL